MGDTARLRWRLRPGWERRKLAVSEWWVAFRCARLNRCPGCNVCDDATGAMAEAREAYRHG